MVLPFTLNSRSCPSHETYVYVKVNQCASDITLHNVHSIKVMHIYSTIVVDNDLECDGVNNWSSINVAQVVIVLQLGGCIGRWRGKDTAQSRIILTFECRCCKQQ